MARGKSIFLMSSGSRFDLNLNRKLLASFCFTSFDWDMKIDNDDMMFFSVFCWILHRFFLFGSFKIFNISSKKWEILFFPSHCLTGARSTSLVGSLWVVHKTSYLIAGQPSSLFARVVEALSLALITREALEQLESSLKTHKFYSFFRMVDPSLLSLSLA